MPPVAVPITPVGPVAAATMLFRENGQLQVAVIVKATFALGHLGPLTVAEPEPILAKEAHRMNNPTRSIVATSDLVPRLPGTDVLLLGQAHAPGGGATHVTVRLRVGRGDETLLDKTVLARGDLKGGEIKPFRAIPLVWEKAHGGPGFRDNPLGTGALAGDPPPNLVDPAAPERPAAFAPLSRSWPSRSSLVTAEARAGLDRPVAEIPPGFDFRYFHAAPPDQRMRHLIGDEWIAIAGVHPEIAELRVELPGAQARVRVVGTESDGRVFSLRCDTLRIDAEAERVTLTWRNSFPVRESDLGAVRLLAGVALPDVPIEWPVAAPAPVAGHVYTSQGGAAPAGHVYTSQAGAASAGGTLVLADEPALGGTMELGDGDFEVELDPASAPPSSGPTLVVLPGLAPSELAPSGLAPSRLPVSSFGLAGAPPHPTPPPAPAPSHPARRNADFTLDLTSPPDVGARPVTPFAGAPTSDRTSGLVRPAPSPGSSPIPGSPWDPARPAAPGVEDSPTFDAESADFAGTLPVGVPSPQALDAVRPDPPRPSEPSAGLRSTLDDRFKK